MAQQEPLQPALGPSNNRGVWVLLAICCALLVLFLRAQGVFLAIVILAVAFFFSMYRPNRREQTTLASSILLSREDILDVLAEYDAFLTSPDAKNLADRTLERPALADENCHHPAIAEFRFLAQSARRFISRIEIRLKWEPTVPQLEALLTVTDKRAEDIRAAWLEARRVAAQLGTDYDT